MKWLRNWNIKILSHFTSAWHTEPLMLSPARECGLQLTFCWRAPFLGGLAAAGHLLAHSVVLKYVCTSSTAWQMGACRCLQQSGKALWDASCNNSESSIQTNEQNAREKDVGVWDQARSSRILRISELRLNVSASGISAQTFEKNSCAHRGRQMKGFLWKAYWEESMHWLCLPGDGFHLVPQTKCSPGLSELQSLQHQLDRSLLLQLFWGSWGKTFEEMLGAVPLACEQEWHIRRKCWGLGK